MSEKNGDRERWLILQRKLSEHRIADVFKYFRSCHIESILIKGWAAGLKYSHPWERTFSDVDLAVDPSDFERAFALLGGKYPMVDLHRGLRHHDTLEWKDIYENSQLVNVEDTEIRVLREEDHLRVLCVHWLTDGGAYKKKLLDVYYAVANRSKNFDWHRCLDTVSERRKKWIIYTIGLAHRYYQLRIDDLPFAGKARNIPVWLIKALEKEWSTDVRLMPLDQCLNDKKMLGRQILKRIPPNPIQATIEMEGDFDAGTRIFYQCGSVATRLAPSLRRLLKTIRAN